VLASISLTTETIGIILGVPGDESATGEIRAINPGDLIRAASTISFARGVLGKGLKGVTAIKAFESTVADTDLAWVYPLN
jgi:stage V sporulation protein SpoVS